MRTRAEMKAVAKENFRRCTGVFVAAAAILLAISLVYSVPNYINEIRNLTGGTSTSSLLGNDESTFNQPYSAQDYAQAQAQLRQAVSRAGSSMLVSLFSLVAAVFLMIIQVGMRHIAIITIAGGVPDFIDLFTPFKRFGRWLGFMLMMGLRIFLWSLLLIIPGIIAALRYSQAIYLMLEDPEMGINEALKKSAKLMQGYKGTYFVLGLSFILWNMLAGITGGLANLYVAPYMELTYVQFYYDLRREHPVEGLPPTMAFAVAAPVAPFAPAAPVSPAPPLSPQAPTPPQPPVPPAPPAPPVQS